MKAFDYAAPERVEDAVKLLEVPHSAALSGGTDLLSRMKDYVSEPERVVYLKDIKDLSGLKEGTWSEKGSSRDVPVLVIGAGTTLADILASKVIKSTFPSLWQATLEVGTPQIRNMATVGGNLCQRPRCWYYRAGNGLLGMKDGKSLVREGDNRYHAIFLTDGNALFVNPSSLAVPLVALKARVNILGKDGTRIIDVADLYRVPRTEKDRELTLERGDLVTEIIIPGPDSKAKNASYEARQKQAHDWPLVLASVNLMMDGDTVKDARIVLGGVAPIPWRSEAAEKAITGKSITEETAARAGEAATEGARPLSMNGYKVTLTKTVVKRALLAIVGNRYWEA